MPPNNKRKKHIRMLATDKHTHSKRSRVDNAKLELSATREGALSNPINENEEQWKDIMAESKSEEEWDKDIKENAWEELLVKMQSNASDNKSHLRAPYTGTSARTLFRQNAKAKVLKASAVGSHSIESYFIRNSIREVGTEVEVEGDRSDDELSDDEEDHE